MLNLVILRGVNLFLIGKGIITGNKLQSGAEAKIRGNTDEIRGVSCLGSQ